VDQTHEQITDPGAVQRFVEERVFAVQDRFLQGTLDGAYRRMAVAAVV
jgi:hypothetical protein